MINISQIFNYILLSAVFLFFGVCSKSIDIDFNSDIDLIFNNIDKNWGLDFILNNLEIESDIVMDNFEKDYLVGLKSNTLISKEDLKSAIANLKKKNHFESAL